MNKHFYSCAGLATQRVKTRLCLFFASTFHTNMNIRLLILSLASLFLVSCGGGGGGGGGSSSSQSTIPSIDGETILLRGSITYERVLPNRVLTFVAGLDYDNIITQPARSIVVQLLDTQEEVIAQTLTDREGRYAFDAPKNATVKVRAMAQLTTADSVYNITIKDNTSNNSPYGLEGSLANTGSALEQVRELHAPLGWNSAVSGYTNPRASAPFAIADTLLKGVELILDADPDTVFPALEVFWSVNNIAAAGALSSGNISTSFYLSGGRKMYVLGHENNDTDEFDSSVLLHEFGHYIEDTLSRSDNIGGNHTLSRPSDLRVAFGEGFGNAFAAISSGESLYSDTTGNAQQRGFGFDVEVNRYGGGAFREGAIQSILLDLVDDASEENDSVALGFRALWSVLSSSRYRNFEGYVSIYLLADMLKQQQPFESANIDALLQRESITSTDAFGGGEVLDLGLSYVLPVHHRLSPGETVEVCSGNAIENFASQEENGFEVNRFILLDIPASGRYVINATRSRGLATSDPDIQLSYRGRTIGLADSNTNNTERLGRTFERDVYVMAIYDGLNADDDESTGGLVCFNVALNAS